MPARADDAMADIAARYRLTRAEAQLLRELLHGRSLAETAARLSRARSTVRNQLQAIFAKTGTHRQGELVAKILLQSPPPES